MNSSTRSRCSNATISKGPTVCDKVVGRTIFMSDGAFDFYQFIVRLNEENQFNFPIHQMVSLTYQGAPSPWPVTRRCTCTCNLEPESTEVNNTTDNNSVPVYCHTCQGYSRLGTKTQAETFPEIHFTSTVGSLICSECSGVQFSHSKHTCAQHGWLSSENPLSPIDRLANRPQVSIHPSLKRKNCSEQVLNNATGGVCSDVGQKSKTRPYKSQNLKAVATISCTCYKSETSGKWNSSRPGSRPQCGTTVRKVNPSKITDGSELECAHDEFIPCEQLGDAVWPSGPREASTTIQTDNQLFTPTRQSSGGGALQEEISTSLNSENPHARCCRVIRLSGREHLLFCRFDKAKNWCEKLNSLLERRGMRVFLKRRSWEVHVRGTLNFDHTRIKLLQTIREATLWWDTHQRNGPCVKNGGNEDHVPNSPEDSTNCEPEAAASNGNTVGHKENVNDRLGELENVEVGVPADAAREVVAKAENCPVDPGLLAPSASTDSAAACQDSVAGQNDQPAPVEVTLTRLHDDELGDSGENESTPQPQYTCDLFPDCQLLATTPDNPCHRIVLADREHETFLIYDRTDHIIEKLNGALERKHLRTSLLKLEPEVHLLSGCEQDRDKVLRMVWRATVDTGLQHKLIPLFKRQMKGSLVESTVSSNGVQKGTGKVARVENATSSDEMQKGTDKAKNAKIVMSSNQVEKGNHGVAIAQAKETASSSEPQKVSVQDNGRSPGHGTHNASNDRAHRVRSPPSMSTYCPCSRFSHRSRDRPNDCYRFPFDTHLSYLQFSVQLLEGGIFGKINSELLQHGFVIGLLHENDELHIRCDDGDFGRACSRLLDAARLYGVDEHLLASFEKLRNSSSHEDYKVRPSLSPPSFIGVTHEGSSTASMSEPSRDGEDYPDCMNCLKPAGSECTVVPVNSNDGTHVALLESDRTDRFVSKLNVHLLDLRAEVRLLHLKPEFHVTGADSQVVLPVLKHLTEGINKGEDVKRRLIFLYPEYARSTDCTDEWNGQCKCHEPTSRDQPASSTNTTRTDTPLRTSPTRYRACRPQAQFRNKFIPPRQK